MIRFNLDKIMDERGLTYAELAAMCPNPESGKPLSTDTILKIVKNRGKMVGVDVLGRLIAALEIEPNDLISVVAADSPDGGGGD